MGYNPVITESSDFLIDTCVLQKRADSGGSSSSNEVVYTWTDQTDLATGLGVLPCRLEPDVNHSKETDRTSAKNTKITFGTHRLWIRKQSTVDEFIYRIFNINGDNKYYEILYVEKFPNDEHTQYSEIVLAETRN